MRKLIWSAPLILLVVVLALIAPVPALAGGTACPPDTSTASGSVVVNERSADITILPNGDVRYVETWVVNFQGSGFRFAFRTIPLNRATDIIDWGVSEGGTVYTNQARGEFVYTLSRSGNERTIHWCFPSTSYQTRTFTLSYTVQGSLGIYEDGDRYFWKFIESDRGYTINSSIVRVHLPTDVNAADLELAGFINGSESLEFLPPGSGSEPQGARSSVKILDSRTIVFFGGAFYSGDEWEIGVRFPHGLVTAEAQTWQYYEDNAAFIALVVLGAAGVFILGGGLGIYLFWYTLGRDKPAGVRVEFIPRPPGDLPPGIAGVLLDETADLEDITSTLVDLARRGYLSILEMDAPRIGRKSDFTFTRLTKDKTGLKPYEERLMRAVFGNRSEKKLSNLKNKFYTSLPEIRKLMYEEVSSHGYFMGNPDRVRQRYGCFGFLLTAFVGLIAWAAFGIAQNFTNDALALCLSASLLVFPLGLLIAARYMPRKTEKGARAAARWGAFKRYLANIDRYASVEDAKEQFDQYLPFAIAFGIEKSWVRHFTQTDVPIPTWYQPYYGGPVARGRGLGRPVSGGAGAPSLDDAAGNMFGGLESMSTGLFTMLDQAGSTFTSAPSSSGGGGGGFSGGGGGGGGSSGFG